MDHASPSSSDSDPVQPPALDEASPPEPAAAEGTVPADASELPPESESVPGPGPAARVAVGATHAAPIQERVLSALKDHITPALPGELATKLGAEEKTLKRLLGKMTRDGSVRRAGGGRFTVSRHYHE